MKILALDTALNACSAAIWTDGRVVARAFESRARGHAEALMPMIEGLRREAGIAYADLDRLAVTVGPGSFAGTRVGLSAARGMALATGLPLIGITTLEAVAFGMEADEAIVAAFDAYRGEIYLQVFGKALEPLTEPLALPADEAAGRISRSRVLLAGNGADRLVPALEARGISWRVAPGREEPDAAVFAGLAALRAPGDAPPSPLYLRPPDAKLPANAA